MVIQAIKQNGKEKLLAIATRSKDGKFTETILCDYNTVANGLRIFHGNTIDLKFFNSFKEAVKYIFSL